MYAMVVRLLRIQHDIKGAIAAYDAAVETLSKLRSDLVAVNQDVQFNFKESVEPVYRQLVALLLESLPPGHRQNANDTKTLDKARQHIEALQLAEEPRSLHMRTLSPPFVKIHLHTRGHIAHRQSIDSTLLRMPFGISMTASLRYS